MSRGQQNRAKILVLEDDPGHTLGMKHALGSDYELTVTRDRGDFMEMALSGKHDLFVISEEGDRLLDLCRSLKKAIHLDWIPIVAITDRRTDHVAALEEGAIDSFPRTMYPEVFALKLKNLVDCKRVHDQVRESEMEARKKLEELESLVQMVVHDLKSPAIAIHGFIGMLEQRCRDLPADARRDEILSYLATTSTKIQDFVKDLAEFLVAEQIKLELSEVSLTAAVEEVLREHQQVIEDRKIDVQVVGNSHCRSTVIGDERRIVEILDNLLRNAINHMGEGPKLQIQISFRELEESVLTRVSDNGIGIPPEFHDKIFSRFFRVPKTGSKSGTGLGLAIVKAIVESHGGMIWVESAPGQGTTFNFTLPKNWPVCAGLHNGTGESCLLNA